MLWAALFSVAVCLGIWGWPALLWIVGLAALAFVLIWISDGLTHRGRLREALQPTGSLLFHMGLAWQEVTAARQQEKASPKASARAEQLVAQASIHDTDDSSPVSVQLPREFLFSYIDHNGGSSRRRVRVMGIASNDGRQYLDGYCLDRNATRTFRVDRIQGALADAETGELINVYSLLATTDKRRHMDYTPAKPEFSGSEAGEEFDDAEPGTTVLFTGFTKARKEELEAAAEAAGWEVRSTVSKSLDYLVCGPKAGPAKTSKAEEIGVTVIDEDVFEVLVT